MNAKSALILGLFIIAAAFVVALMPRPQLPVRSGVLAEDVDVRYRDGILRLECAGFRVDSYPEFVQIHVKKGARGSWSSDRVLVYPWAQIESLTLEAGNK